MKTQITPDIQALITQAVAIGVQQGIEQALQTTSTTAPKARKRLTFKQVADLIRLSQPTIRRIFKKEPGYTNTYDPTFPKPHKLGGPTNYWFEDEIIKWNNKTEKEQVA